MPPNHRLRTARERAGLTQGEAAIAMQVNEMQVSKWERGVNKPGADSLEKLATAYGVAVGDLLSEQASEVGKQAPTAAADTVPVSRETIGYLRGKLETTVAWLASVEAQMGALGSSVHAVGETLTALRGALDQATTGVAGLLKPGEFPGPNDNGVPPKPLSKRDTLTAVDASGLSDVPPQADAASE